MPQGEPCQYECKKQITQSAAKMNLASGDSSTDCYKKEDFVTPHQQVKQDSEPP